MFPNSVCFFVFEIWHVSQQYLLRLWGCQIFLAKVCISIMSKTMPLKHKHLPFTEERNYLFFAVKWSCQWSNINARDHEKKPCIIIHEKENYKHLNKHLIINVILHIASIYSLNILLETPYFYWVGPHFALKTSVLCGKDLTRCWKNSFEILVHVDINPIDFSPACSNCKSLFLPHPKGVLLEVDLLTEKAPE